MRKLIKSLSLIPLVGVLMSFTTKISTKVITNPTTALTVLGVISISEKAEAQSKINFYDDFHIYVDTFVSLRTQLPGVQYVDIYGKPSFSAVAFTGSYYDLGFQPQIPVLTGYGIYNNNGQYGVDTTSIMSVTRANSAISTMTTNIDAKVPKTMSITINGVTQNLSASRTWSIPTATNTNQLVNGSGFLTSEVDGSVTNELQTLSGSNTKTLTLSGGGSFIIPNITSGEITTALGTTPLTSETQSLSISSNSLSIKSGTTTINTITLPTATSPTLSLSTNSLTISNGNTVVFKRQEKYNGTTNSSGLYSVTFATPYSSVPDIQANIINGNNKWTQITNVSTTGFSVYIQLRTDLIGLLPTYSDVNGAAVRVLITEQ